jgi:hypothetical protein
VISDTFDEGHSQDFVQRMQGLYNASGLVLMISVGHQTGLFDVLAGLPPSTSEQIAAVAGLQERYVREWLGALVTGRITDNVIGAVLLPSAAEDQRSDDR